MIILESGDRYRDDSQVVAAFGIGLIGRSIVRSLNRRADWESTSLLLDWNDSSTRLRQLRTIEENIARRLDSVPVLTVIWSAGTAGFLSTAAETEVELDAFRDVVKMTEHLASSLRKPAAFHLISSAGGLFEGQRFVGARTEPSPRRPYGKLKVDQENLLASARTLSTRIYRVSSVYGYLQRGTRPGFVSKMISDALHRSVTYINGTASTLRDFVFAEDVGTHIASRVLERTDDGLRIDLLTRNRPCTLLEVQHVIETAVGRKTYVSYSTDAANSADITFAADPVPGWLPSDLRANVGLIYRAALAGALV